jgi:isopentenyl-diphosphate Delta-isomerase
MSDAPPTDRKDQHLDVVLSGRGRHARDAGFDSIRFVHEALPDLDHDKIDLGADFLGRRLKAPLLISSIVGIASTYSRFERSMARSGGGHRI